MRAVMLSVIMPSTPAPAVQPQSVCSSLPAAELSSSSVPAHTGCAVEQEAVERDTGAAAERAVQALLGLDAAALAVAPRKDDVAFGADHEISPLPVRAGIAADVETVDIDFARPRRCPPCPAVAAEHAEIEAGPVVSRRGFDDVRRRQRLDIGEIGRESRGCENSCGHRADENRKTHQQSPGEPAGPAKMPAGPVVPVQASSGVSLVSGAGIMEKTRIFLPQSGSVAILVKER